MEKYLNKNKKRRKKIENRKYIPIAPYHWGKGWYFNTMPIINRISFYKNKGIGVYTRTSWWTGCDFFLPAKSDEIIKKNYWVE